MSPNSQYTISEERKRQFAGIYLLEYMINAPKAFQLMLEREEADLEPILEWLLVRELIRIKDEEKYVPTEKGRQALQRFMQRYSDFLTYFDVFCAVDLQEGSFAFSRYFDFASPSEWNAFLAQDRWEDLRIAVAQYKGIDPVEIVFMSFLNEERFGRNETGWQFDLLLGSVWEEILRICNAALSVDQLGWEDEQGRVAGEEVLRDVARQGLALVEELHRREGLPDPGIAHPVADAPSDAAVESVRALRQRSNAFDDSPEPPDYWKDPWAL